MVRSKLWAAQDALFTLLDASAGLGDASVTLGRPPADEGDQVWVSGEVDLWSAEYAVSGLGAKDESFTLQVRIRVNRVGTTYTTVRDVARDYGRAVEDVIAANPTLSGTVMLANISNVRLEDALLDERTRGCALVIDVACRAWLDA
jgi:hypothetical protein